MKSRIIAIFILIFSLNSMGYSPVFLHQEELDKSSEKLIIKIDSVFSKITYPKIKYPAEYLDFYDVDLSVQVQFVGQSDSDLRVGDILYFSYSTTKYKSGVSQILCGHQPLKIPEEQSLYVAYLNKEGDNYKLKEGPWALQDINDVYQSLDYYPSSVPDWVKPGLNKTATTTVE